MERLAVCYREISGVLFAFSAPPSDPWDAGMVPAAVVLMGGLAGPSNRTTEYTEQVRNYIVRLFFAPVSQGMDGTVSSSAISIGAEKYQLATPFPDRVHSYFNAHPRLQTDAGSDANPLGSLARDVTTTDSGIVARNAPGGAQYWCIEFVHQISVRLRDCWTES
jgi:hypothetical protein